MQQPQSPRATVLLGAALSLPFAVLLFGAPAEARTIASEPPDPARTSTPAHPAAFHAAGPHASVEGVEGLPDPDGVGPCPIDVDSPVVRRFLDGDTPTWEHEDKSITVRVQADSTGGGGMEIVEPGIARWTAAALTDSRRKD